MIRYADFSWFTDWGCKGGIDFGALKIELSLINTLFIIFYIFVFQTFSYWLCNCMQKKQCLGEIPSTISCDCDQKSPITHYCFLCKM